MKAFLKNYRQSPRKVRLVTDLVKGKTVKQALVELSFLPKRASLPIKKLIESAAANAKSTNKANVEDLVISNITVDKGIVLKRRMPRARGSATPINRRSSHIKIELKEKSK
ncbi:50S ribosomal protein L22 [Candidatus Nomurabacteria bacterium]|nr:50S ribosomal protein L22 [Candidatus Nomurabacteria bacterium]MCB9820758.1 50S ribosomal protein L22 [Candidatus Nomurabacteria bacterium]